MVGEASEDVRELFELPTVKAVGQMGLGFAASAGLARTMRTPAAARAVSGQ
jgi:hypothetical protein